MGAFITPSTLPGESYNAQAAQKAPAGTDCYHSQESGAGTDPIALDKIVDNVNRSLKGWANYFHYRNSNQVMEKVKTHAEQRLRAHLVKRHKVKG